MKSLKKGYASSSIRRGKSYSARAKIPVLLDNLARCPSTAVQYTITYSAVSGTPQVGHRGSMSFPCSCSFPRKPPCHYDRQVVDVGRGKEPSLLQFPQQLVEDKLPQGRVQGRALQTASLYPPLYLVIAISYLHAAITEVTTKEGVQIAEDVELLQPL